MIKVFLTIVMSVFLTSCITLSSSSENFSDIAWSKRQQQLATINTWRFTGEVAVRDRQQAQSASVVWLQNVDQYQISIFGPLGIGRTELNGDATKVMLKTKEKIYYASSPEKLMSSLLGWSMPISPLTNWVRGMPAALPIQKMNFDQYHHITQLIQAGWTIDYLAYGVFDGIDLPTKIRLTHGELRLIWAIGEWDISNN